MKLDRSKNAIRNMKASFLNTFVSLVGPFLVRTVFIKSLGAEYLGINSLFSSVLSVLSLTELGFGSAVVFNMYKAIAEDDDDMMNALLNFYKRVYHVVGSIILAIGLLLIPFLPYLVNGEYPSDINAIVVYLLFLANTVLSYFLHAYLDSLLYAFQRTDITTKIGMYISVVKYVMQIILLVTIRNYYIYLIVIPVFTVVTNIRTAILAKKNFPQYRPYGKINKSVAADIKERVSGLLIQKICQTSRNSFDSIFISMFLGLTQIAIYNNYYYIMSSVVGFMSIATSAVLAGVGNSIATETQEKNHQDMLKFNFIYMWIAGWCTICLLCLYQQFMNCWVGEDMLLPMSSVILICIYFYVMKMGDVRYLYSEASGLWWYNRYRSMAEAIANIVLNYFLGKYFGINGILMATIITILIINFGYGSQIIYKHYFTGQNLKVYFASHAIYIAVTFIICLITFVVCGIIPENYFGFIVKMIICVILPNVLYYIIYRKTKMYSEAIPWLLQRVGIKESSFIWKIAILND